LISAVGLKLQSEWIQPQQRGYQNGATISVLNVGRVHDGLHQQTSLVHQHVLIALAVAEKLNDVSLKRSMPAISRTRVHFVQR
jgi:hypothetical protein